jgi:photosystem II stability/assembly factor-like uncharacterized protein
MSLSRLATSVVITVLATLVVGAIGYGAVAHQLHRTAAVQQPTPSPEPSLKPLPTPVPPASPPAPGRLFVWDADFVDQLGAWLLLSDCNPLAAPSCRYSVEWTENAGATWTEPVLVGPVFASTDGDAPRMIRFLDRANGFVYGHTSVYVTHNGGRTWADAGFQGAEVVGISGFENTVWGVTRPCAKGVTCPYVVRSSQDAGRTWSAAHQLPASFSPDSVVAFGSGAILSTIPPGNIELTADHGATWQELKSPCPENRFRGAATTADGVEVWVLCQGYPDAFGAINDASIAVSEDAGKTWSPRGVAGILPAWLESPQPKVALVAGKGPIVRTSDSGATWADVSPGGGPFAFARFMSPDRGWAMETSRNAWFTSDGGQTWLEVATLPNTRP